MRSMRFAALVTTVVAVYDSSLDFKTDGGLPLDQRASLCVQARAMLNGSLATRDALRGLHLTMLTPLYDPPWFDEPIGNTDPALMTGLHASLAAELAKSAGFTYTIVSHPLSSFEPDLSWTDYLLLASQRYDLVLDWWAQTQQRTAMGLTSPYTFLDMSIVPATRLGKSEGESLTDLMGIAMKPFTTGLWLVVLGCTLVTAFAFIMIEGRAVADQDRFDDFEAADASWYSLVGEALYLGFIQLTGAGGYNPGTTLGKLLFAGYSLFVLFAVNSYTANLAASAITTQVAKCNSFEACTAKGHRVCVRSGTASDSVVTRLHGELGEQIVRTTSEWMSLDAGDCEIIAAPKVILDLQKVDGDYNEDCSIERIGVHPINTMDGGWMQVVGLRTAAVRMASVPTA